MIHLLFALVSLALADTPFPKVTSPFGPPKTTPLTAPTLTTTTTPAPKKTGNSNQKPQMPQLPQMPGGGGTGGKPNAAKASENSNSGGAGEKSTAAGSPRAGTASRTPAKSSSNGDSAKSADGDGLCTSKNSDKVQMKEKGCDALEASLESECSSQKLQQILKRSKTQGGISDLERYCPGFDKMSDGKKSEVFKQMLAGLIHAQSKWSPNKGLLRISKTDVDQNQACHDIDLSKDLPDSAKTLKCGTCVALTKIAADGKVAPALGDSRKAVEQAMKGYCKNGARDPAAGTKAPPPADPVKTTN